MAKGILNIQAADGAVIGLHVPDGLASGERTLALGTNLSGITAYHLLQGNLAVSNSTITQGFNTTLYTGNGTTQAVNTGIDMSTQWGNTAEETFGGLVWVKGRSNVTSHYFGDTIRGSTWNISSDSTTNQLNNTTGLTAITSTGFNVGSLAAFNSSGWTFSSWNFQTTHRITGTTNHGKAYTCHYNPFTGFTMVKYEGSGIAGHEIPHHLGRKLGFCVTKSLSGVYDWVANATDKYLYLNKTDASPSNYVASNETVHFVDGTGAAINASANNYIMYGWANSYTDESSKLIGNYEIGVYQGTGAVGNKIKTRGNTAWVMIKRLDVADGWLIYDNQRGDNYLSPNTSAAEGLYDALDINSDGFTLKQTTTSTNASGGQYLYIVAYDTNSNGGGSYYPLANDTATVQINNALIPLAQGIDGNGAKNTIISKNGTITGLAYTAGKNYVYCDKNGSYGVSAHRPRYLESDLIRTYAGESPDYYNVVTNKWYSTNTAELVTNGTFSSGTTTGWSTDAGIVLSVSNGALLNTASISSSGYTYQSITTVVGKTYKFKAYINNVNMYQYGLLINDSLNTLFTETITATGAKTYDITFVAQSTTTNIKFFRNSSASGQTLIIDNVTCFPTDIIPTTEITNSRNYLNHIVHADNDGGVLYVEELPKIEYRDVVKANEYKGKNACTAWVNFDGTTTPPTIRDSYNVSAVIRTATGYYDIYFKEPMDNNTYSGFVSYTWQTNVSSSGSFDGGSIYKCQVRHAENGAHLNTSINTVHIYGGRN